MQLLLVQLLGFSLFPTILFADIVLTSSGINKASHTYNLKCFGSSTLQNIPCLFDFMNCEQLEFGNQPVCDYKHC